MNTDKLTQQEPTINQCPEFPYFGAWYPDATCINGVLYDLDDCDENGNLYEKDDTPCPFCRTEAFIEHEVGSPEDYEAPEEYQAEVDSIKNWMQAINDIYNKTAKVEGIDKTKREEQNG